MPPDVGTDDRELLCLYLAVQMARTPRKRTGPLFGRNVTAYANGREVDLALMTEYLTRKHLGHPPRAAEAQGAWDYYHGRRAMNGGNDPTHDEAVAVTLSSVRVCIPQYRARHWRLETCRKPIFLTSDAPLVLWRPETPEDAYRGFGLEGAHEIRFPVSPTAQLVLVPGHGTSAEEVRLSRVNSCNQDLADTCEQVVIGHPDGRIDDQRGPRAAWLRRQTPRSTARGPRSLRFVDRHLIGGRLEEAQWSVPVAQ